MHRILPAVALGLTASLALASAQPLPASNAPLQEAEAAAPQQLLIRAGRLIVRPGHVIEGGMVHVRDGRIVAVGTDLVAPDGVRTVEGEVVCAGFIDSWSTLGLGGSNTGEPGATPSTRTVDAIDPYSDDHLRSSLLSSGVVAARVQSGNSARIAGLGAVVTNHPGHGLDELVLNDAACVSARVTGRDAFERLDSVQRLAGTIEGGAAYREAQLDFERDLAEWEEAIAEKVEELEKGFKKAKKKRDEAIEEAEEEGKTHKEEKYKEDRRPRAPKYNPDSEVMARVATGELPIVVEADRVTDIRALIAAMDTLPRVRWILASATDAGFFASELAERRVPVLITPQVRGRGGYDADELELAGQLQREGVTVLIGSDGERSGRDLALLAAQAVGHGMDRDAALAAITSAPARAFDLGQVAGTVEAGKQAHLLVLSGDPLSSTTRVEAVVLSGDVVLER